MANAFVLPTVSRQSNSVPSPFANCFDDNRKVWPAPLPTVPKSDIALSPFANCFKTVETVGPALLPTVSMTIEKCGQQMLRLKECTLHGCVTQELPWRVCVKRNCRGVCSWHKHTDKKRHSYTTPSWVSWWSVSSVCMCDGQV